MTLRAHQSKISNSVPLFCHCHEILVSTCWLLTVASWDDSIVCDDNFHPIHWNLEVVKEGLENMEEMLPQKITLSGRFTDGNEICILLLLYVSHGKVSCMQIRVREEAQRDTAPHSFRHWRQTNILCECEEYSKHPVLALTLITQPCLDSEYPFENNVVKWNDRNQFHCNFVINSVFCVV